MIGTLDSVKDTPLDFTTPTPIGRRMDQVGGDVKGYDINYVLDKKEFHSTESSLCLCAT